MNENNGYNGSNVTPYRASGNLNTAIGNPTVNINDTMNVNIQSVATEQQLINGNAQNNVQLPIDGSSTVNNNTNVVNNPAVNTQSKTYVTADNKPKKKNISLNLGPEFKIAFLIMVILLVFIFLLPMISDLFRG